MNRRDFILSSAAAGGAAAFMARTHVASAAPKGPFSELPLKMSVPIDWFPGTTEEKLDKVAEWGFPAYEWLNPECDPVATRAKADALGVELSCIVGAGAIAPGQMVDPDDHDRLVKQFEDRIVLAKALGCKRLIGLSGNTRRNVPFEKQMENMAKCLKRLAPMAEQNDLIIVLEALNPLVDHKGFFLTRTDQTMEIIQEVGSPRVKMLFDIYHQQITEGNVIRNFTKNIDRIGHFHVADNPGRKEPGSGELNYANIFKAIAETNYNGFVALECGSTTKNNDDILKATLKCFGVMA